MYPTEHKIRSRLYLTLLVWISVQTPSAHADEKRLHPEHSLFYPMPNDPNLWNLGGSARFHDGVLTLVPSQSNRAGVAWNGIPVDYCNWEVNIAFSIQSGGYYFADGWALFYTMEPITEVVLDPYKNIMGGPNDYQGVALIHDTYNSFLFDTNFPRLYALVSGGSDRYYHYRNGWSLRRYSCHFSCLNDQCRIKFEYWNRNLYVTAMDWNGNCKDYKRFENVVLPAGGYFSFTAFNDYYYETVNIHEFKVEEYTDANECFERDGQTPKW
ncbi:unnamed protein product [Calicophoron daubneyi]|uniref:L-type lectin-like domain-containing protein n=1 Tax=Calicophoron daubneyi TaxID=300641 RepID=A0AAV2TQE5_CALDB